MKLPLSRTWKVRVEDEYNKTGEVENMHVNKKYIPVFLNKSPKRNLAGF